VFVLLITDRQLNGLEERAELDKQSIADHPDSRNKKRLVASIEKDYLRELKLRQTYKTSGLFSQGSPDKFLWAYSGGFDFMWAGDIKVANDGVHVVFVNGWIPASRTVLEFIRSGHETRSYRSDDFVTHDQTRKTVHGEYWSGSKAVLVEKNRTLLITKVNGSKLEFDLKDGSLKRGKLQNNRDANH
jgi:hypothetical protein